MIKKNFLKILLIVFFVLLLSTTVSNAAISASSKTVNSGENVSISITSNVPVVSYKVTMNGSGGLTFVTSSGGTGAGSATITDAKATGMTSLATYTFKAPSVTQDTTYTVSFTATAMEDEDFNAVDNSTATAKITVKAPVVQNPSTGGSTSSGSSNNTGSGSGNSSTSNSKPSTSGSSTTTTKPKEEEKKSNDSTLKGLIVEGQELYPVFEKNTREYNLRVTNDITKVTVVPTVNYEKASFKIEGITEELVVGKNVITVVVTAEDGSKTNYIINVTRNREGLNVSNIKLSYIDDKGTKQEIVFNPIFNSEVLEYTVDNLSYLVDKLDVEVLANFEEAKIEITGNENLVEGENILKITVTMPSENEEEADEVLIYTIKVNKEAEPVITLMGRIENWFNGITGTVSTWLAENVYEILMGALMLCSFALGGLSVYLFFAYKKYKLMLQKIAELTKMNSTQTAINIVQENEENIQIDSETEPEIKRKGRHF